MNRTALLQRILKLPIVLTVLIVIGTAGMCHIESWPAQDSLATTTITMASMGVAEVGDISPQGRAFYSCLVLAFIVSLACWTGGTLSGLMTGDFATVVRNWKLKRMVRKMKQHVIICGSGAFARAILEMLYGGEQDVVLVSDNENEIDWIRQRYADVPILKLPPTDELALAEANLAGAAHVVAATDSDVDNLLISITCKTLSPALVVYTFSLEGNHSSRMAKVGVDEIVSPHMLGGARVAELIQRHEAKKANAPMLAEYLTH